MSDLNKDEFPALCALSEKEIDAILSGGDDVIFSGTPEEIERQAKEYMESIEFPQREKLSHQMTVNFHGLHGTIPHKVTVTSDEKLHKTGLNKRNTYGLLLSHREHCKDENCEVAFDLANIRLTDIENPALQKALLKGYHDSEYRQDIKDLGIKEEL